MVWAVSFTSTAEKTFGKLDRPLQRRIQKFIDRIGDHRLVCEIKDKTTRILVIAIGDRKEVYR